MIVSNHAAERFMQKTGCKNIERATFRLQKMFRSAKHVTKIRRGTADEIDPEKDCTYYAGSGWVFVMDKGKMVTCYFGTKGRTYL